MWYYPWYQTIQIFHVRRSYLMLGIQQVFRSRLRRCQRLIADVDAMEILEWNRAESGATPYQSGVSGKKTEFDNSSNPCFGANHENEVVRLLGGTYSDLLLAQIFSWRSGERAPVIPANPEAVTERSRPCLSVKRFGYLFKNNYSRKCGCNTKAQVDL